MRRAILLLVLSCSWTQCEHEEACSAVSHASPASLRHHALVTPNFIRRQHCCVVLCRAEGERQWRIGNLRAARRCLQLLSRADVFDARARCDLASVELELGERELAQQLFREALAVDPELVEAINGLGVAAAREGDYAGAVEIWSRALKVPGGYSAVGLNLATALRRMGRAAEAANVLLGLQSEGRLVDASLLSMSALLLREHGGEGPTIIAERCYRAARRLEPQDALHAYRLANVLLDGGAVRQSISLYRRALIITPTLAAAENNMGNALRTLGRSDALAAFSRAVALEPSEPSFWVNHGAALLVRLSRRIHSYDACHTHADRHGFHRLEAYMQDSDVDAAIDSFLRAIASDARQVASSA